MVELDNASKNAAHGWAAAILDAEHLAERAEARAVRLRNAIRVFRQMEESGEPWPGTSETVDRSVQRVRALIEAKRLKAFKYGREWLIDPKDLEAREESEGRPSA